MKSHDLREDMENVISKLIKHPSFNQIKDLISEHLLSLMIEEFRLFLNKYFSEQKAQINEAILVTIKWVLKEEFVHEFENTTLDKITTKITDPIIDRIATKILENIKEDLMSKDMLFNIISGMVKEFFLRNDEQKELKTLEDG